MTVFCPQIVYPPINNVVSPTCLSNSGNPACSKETITGIMCQTYPSVHSSTTANRPYLKPPYGKRELLAIYLRQIHITCLVLSIDSGDEKCVGVAVWTGPTAKQKSAYERFMSKLSLTWLNIWLFFGMIYYKGMDARVHRHPIPCWPRKARWDKCARELREPIIGPDRTDQWFLHFLASRNSREGDSPKR